MAKQQRLSERLSLTPGTKRAITGDEFSDMQRQAVQLEQENDRLRREQRARLEVHEAPIYGPGSGFSWFADLARATHPGAGWTGDGGPGAARERLSRHTRYQHAEDGRRLTRLRAQAEYETERALSGSPQEAALLRRWQDRGGELFEMQQDLRDLERRAINRTDGSGGYFSPPGYFIESFVAPLVRVHRSPRCGSGCRCPRVWTRLMCPGSRSARSPVRCRTARQCPAGISRTR
jgi:hypothetical protein